MKIFMSSTRNATLEEVFNIFTPVELIIKLENLVYKIVS